jgi:exopolysaccharide biosynthesis polyprenyl glycosylphosphotransferase
VARQHFVDEIFITAPTDQERVTRLALQARRQRLNVNVVSHTYDDLAWKAPVGHFLGYPILQLHHEPISISGLFTKRLLDLMLSILLIVLTFPIAALTALAIKLDSVGPVLYVSVRVGKKGRIFKFYKFRTMVHDADRLKPDLLHLNERNGLLFKISDDPRVTRVGRLLRKFSLDELPQLWNVLRGEMSMVGPRPPVPDEYDHYSLDYLRRMDVTPGITGLWQVSARTDPSFERYVSLDLEYIERWNFLLDCRILFKTLPAVLRGTGQ